MYVDNCDATNEAEGGRWRRSRHLRRVQRPRQGGTGNDRVGFSIPCKSLFFERSFHEITNEFCSESVQKRACKKGHTHADRQTDRIGPIRSSSGTMFWTAKTQIPPADGSKSCPQNDLRIQLTSQLKSTSGLPRSLHSPQMAPAAQKHYL